MNIDDIWGTGAWEATEYICQQRLCLHPPGPPGPPRPWDRAPASGTGGRSSQDPFLAFARGEVGHGKDKGSQPVCPPPRCPESGWGRHTAQLPHAHCPSCLVFVSLCPSVCSLLPVLQTQSSCPVTPVSLSAIIALSVCSSASVILHLSVRLTPSSIFICPSSVYLSPSRCPPDTEVDGSVQGAAGRCGPCVLKSPGWPGDRRGLDSVMVSEGAWRSPGPLGQGWGLSGPASSSLPAPRPPTLGPTHRASEPSSLARGRRVFLWL